MNLLEHQLRKQRSFLARIYGLADVSIYEKKNEDTRILTYMDESLRTSIKKINEFFLAKIYGLADVSDVLSYE